MNRFKDKKIGIWGFGIVGKSALTFFDTQKVKSIQILDTQEITTPQTTTPITFLLQNDQSIKHFLDNNDYILPSPGIKLHVYTQYTDKFINELDLFQKFTDYKTIAITGTIGKTTITTTLEHIFKKIYPDTIAAGNIGNPMLSLISEQSVNACPIILELSSFQLQQSKSFSPNFAIITNFFPNHLDHHQSIEEYFDAKCNILKHQTDEQKALIPLDLLQKITKKINLNKNWIFFSYTKPTDTNYHNKIYYLENRIIYKQEHNKTEQIFDCSTLPAVTFDQNWLIIIATCYEQNIPLTTISLHAQGIKLPAHRLQKIASVNGSNFYNDSKSTVWQATWQAVQSIGEQPIKLFLGGLSKGADRTPLIQALQTKNITVYAFGKESQDIGKLCTQFSIPHEQHQTLDSAFKSCTANLNIPHEILFSPGGSSFDLFENYQTRGDYFIKLVKDLIHQKQNKAHL